MPLTFNELQKHLQHSLDELIAYGYPYNELKIFVPNGMLPDVLPGYIRTYNGIPIEVYPWIAPDTFYIRSPEPITFGGNGG